MGYEKPKQELVTKKLHELVDASKKMNESKEEILKLKYEYFFNILIPYRISSSSSTSSEGKPFAEI
jgi:hypothetical protein